MYLYIGNEDIVTHMEIIGIFTLDCLKSSNFNKEILIGMESEIKKAKSLVITDRKKQKRNILSNISTKTLQKKIENKT